MLGTSTWFEDNQPFRNDTTNYDFGREMFWDANKITGLSASTSKVEHFRLCNVRIQTNAPNGNSLGYDCDGTVVSYDKQLTASSQLVSSVSGQHPARKLLYILAVSIMNECSSPPAETGMFTVHAELAHSVSTINARMSIICHCPTSLCRA